MKSCMCCLFFLHILRKLQKHDSIVQLNSCTTKLYFYEKIFLEIFLKKKLLNRGPITTSFLVRYQMGYLICWPKSAMAPVNFYNLNELVQNDLQI